MVARTIESITAHEETAKMAVVAALAVGVLVETEVDTAVVFETAKMMVAVAEEAEVASTVAELEAVLTMTMIVAVVVVAEVVLEITMKMVAVAVVAALVAEAAVVVDSAQTFVID